jgi:uncharacterized membrane protein
MTEMTQSGLSENGAGALSYITVIPAIIFLVMPPYNKSSYIRFHAWQCIFFTIACIVLWIAMFIVRAILWSIPFVGLMIYPLMLILDLGVFILWLVVVLKALNGQRFSLPIIGALAESQAARQL